MGKLRIAITGGTGFIGSHIIFEFIKLFKNRLNDLELIILGRDAKEMPLKQRIKFLMKESGFSYLGTPDGQPDINLYFDNEVKYMHADLVQSDLGLNPHDLAVLKTSPIDIFLHAAASTDLRESRTSEKILHETNVDGTKRVLDLVSVLKVGLFGYIGTAYVYENKTDVIMPDCIETEAALRNPYEKSKLISEEIVRDYSKKTGLKCKFFRPSVVCGRLMEEPLGFTNNFNVFYAWFAFFWRLRLKQLSKNGENQNNKVHLDLRVCFNHQSGLNVVPVDYVAKLICQLCLQDSEGDSFHIVANNESPYSLLLTALKQMGIFGVQHVENIPVNLNLLEKLYYKVPGRIFTPYLLEEYRHFHVDNLNATLKCANLACPAMGMNQFNVILKYAQKHNFGI